MPDILIRVDMPRNCFECPLFSNCDACEGHTCGCGLLGSIGYEEDISEDRRRDDCPLVELPPHGDLIDRNEILKRSPDHWDEEYIEGDDEYVYRYYLDSTIENAPFIVPAEEGST